MKILIHKTREVKSPTRGTSESAGIDFYLPKIDSSFIEDLVSKNPQLNQYEILVHKEEEVLLTIPPLSRILIPSGIKVSIPRGTALIAANKSGISHKRGCIFTAQVVDSDYTGEIHLGIMNTNQFTPVSFKEGEKIIQFLHQAIFLSEIEEVDKESYDFLTQNSERGEGGFGSTDNK